MRGARKYGNTPVVIDGVRFASKAEGRRYEQLRLLERAGEIAELELQPRFPIQIGDTKVTTYVADFRYVDLRTGLKVVEDVKGVKTTAYQIKKKLVKAHHGVDIVEIAA